MVKLTLASNIKGYRQRPSFEYSTDKRVMVEDVPLGRLTQILRWLHGHDVEVTLVNCRYGRGKMMWSISVNETMEDKLKSAISHTQKS